jgi:putative addiction module component (TIGR02574 family)
MEPKWMAHAGPPGYPTAMSDAELKQLLAQALALPPAERLGLVTKLLDSVEGSPDPVWQNTWLAELDRRAAKMDNGDGHDWSSVEAEIAAQLRPR